MSATVVRCRQTSAHHWCSKHLRPKRCFHRSATLLSDSQPESSVGPQQVSKEDTSGSIVTQLIEETELSPRQTRSKGRKRVAERLIRKNSIEDFLGHLQTTQHDLNLEDLERYRPQKIVDSKSADFERAYNEAVDSLVKSFSVEQLRQFIILSGLQLRYPRSPKRVLASKIVEEKWGWPSLEKVLQEKIDWSEIAERQFYLDPAQSFLVMGKDGSNLLAMSKRYNVSLSFSANPMSLRVTGLKGALKQVEVHLEAVKKDIDFELVPLPFGKQLGAETEQFLSRLSGAHIKYREGKKLAISYLKRQPQTLSAAKQLIMQSATEKSNAMERPLFLPENSVSAESSTSQFSLFPFSPQQSLPWHVPPAATFRYRRIGTWTNAAHLSHPEEARPLMLDKMFGHGDTTIDLQTYLPQILKNELDNAGSPSLKARFGHLLFLSPSGQPATLVPPLVGPTHAATALQWAIEHPNQVVFNPSLPKVASTGPAFKEKIFRRLVYQADPSADSRHTLGTLTMEVPQKESQGPLSDTQMISADEADGIASRPEAISCSASIEKRIDILLPIRQIDVSLAAVKSQGFPVSDLPEDLRIFLLQRAQLPDSLWELPVSFTHLGVNYFLRTDSYVRQQLKKINTGDTPIDLLIETVFHPGSGQVATHCEVTSQDFSSAAGWKEFMQACDLLTQTHELEIRKPPETFSPFDL